MVALLFIVIDIGYSVDIYSVDDVISDDAETLFIMLTLMDHI